MCGEIQGGELWGGLLTEAMPSTYIVALLAIVRGEGQGGEPRGGLLPGALPSVFNM